MGCGYPRFRILDTDVGQLESGMPCVHYKVLCPVYFSICYALCVSFLRSLESAVTCDRLAQHVRQTHLAVHIERTAQHVMLKLLANNSVAVHELDVFFGLNGRILIVGEFRIQFLCVLRR